MTVTCVPVHPQSAKAVSEAPLSSLSDGKDKYGEEEENAYEPSPAIVPQLKEYSNKSIPVIAPCPDEDKNKPLCIAQGPEDGHHDSSPWQ